MPEIVGKERAESGDARQAKSRRTSVEGKDDPGGEDDHDRRTLKHPIVDFDRVVFQDGKGNGEQGPAEETGEAAVEARRRGEHAKAGQRVTGGEHESASSETCHSIWSPGGGAQL